MDIFAREINAKIKDLYGLDVDADVTPSPENISADYSTNIALKLAKELHKSPLIIAEEISLQIPHSSVSAPGFINYTIPDEFLSSEISTLSEDFAGAVSSDTFAGQTIVCEFSDPNPFKVLHVGHLYTSIVGDSISRLFENAGARVIRANFGGDVGLHVAKTMYALKGKNQDDLTIEDIAKCYVEGTAAYEDNDAAHQEITKLNKEIYHINAADIHGTELSNLYWRGRELSYDYFKDFYARIGVHFDKFYPESAVADLGLAKVREQLANGVYQQSDGAVIFDGEKYGLHTRVFINKEGVPTYETKDVGLIFTKWLDWHFDKSVVITGNEQLDYMKVVLKSVEQYAPELVERTTHLTHGLVKLPGNEKMSSRKGNFLKAVDVLDMITDELDAAYGSKDARVVMGACKYAFLKYKIGGNIIFDPSESVKMTGNSGPYLLYSTVRAKKILEKVSATNKAKDYVYNPAERALAKKILEYKQTLNNATSEMAPHKVAGYLYEISQEFSRFYEQCPVAGSEAEAERAELVRLYLSIMTHGLNILGIEAPEEM